MTADRRPIARVLAPIGCLLMLALSVPSVAAMGATPVHPRSIGGEPVASAAEAPWSAYLVMSLEGSEVEGSCSGSIVDSTHVLTAGHCTYDGQTPWSAYEVRAGISSLAPVGQPQEQTAHVVGVRREPYYVADTFVHDVALLRVEPPFDFSTAAVRPIGIARSSEPPAPGTGLRLAGWGLTAPGGSQSQEHFLTQTTLPGWQCAWPGLPSFSCSRSPSGSPCAGDSGAGLTRGSPPTLVATTSVTKGPSCAVGEISGGTDLTSPEISRWLEGDEAPPRAPEAETFSRLVGSAAAGGSAECLPARWTGSPSLGTAFLYLDTGQVVQAGSSPTYSLGAADAGHRLACVSIAKNDGGSTEMVSNNSTEIIPTYRADSLVKVATRSRRGCCWRVRLDARPPAVGEGVRALWTVKGCRACRRSRGLVLRAHTTLVFPAAPRRGAAVLKLRIPALESAAASYTASVLTLRLRGGK